MELCNIRHKHCGVVSRHISIMPSSKGAQEFAMARFSYLKAEKLCKLGFEITSLLLMRVNFVDQIWSQHNYLDMWDAQITYSKYGTFLFSSKHYL